MIPGNLALSLHEKFRYLCIITHSLKFTICRTREQTGFLLSFFVTLKKWAIYLHIREGGVKYRKFICKVR